MVGRVGGVIERIHLHSVGGCLGRQSIAVPHSILFLSSYFPLFLSLFLSSPFSYVNTTDTLDIPPPYTRFVCVSNFKPTHIKR